MGRIVVGVDGSASADRALAWAATRARATGTPLEVLHGYVVHPRGGVLLHDEREAAERTLDQVVERNRVLLDGLEWSASVMPALWAASSALIDAADRADLVVVGSRGLGGFKELLVGSTSYRTAAHATVPVAVIRGAPGTEDHDDRRPVVVGVDGSRVGGRALRWALAEARRRAVPLTAVHAYDVPANVALLGMIPDEALRRLRARARDEAVELLEAALRDAGAQDDDAVEAVVEEGTPAAALLQHAGADHLLVVGTHGRGGARRALLGSVSHQCLHHAAGPVVVVP